jgi:hypothetical protein
MSTGFRVTWTIDVEADSPEAAAREALRIQRKPDSTATVFDVGVPGDDPIRIDLEEAQSEKALPRWKCPCCDSPNVQVSFPTWYHETVTGPEQASADLEFVETDSEADISWWYCENCDESDNGSPVEIEYGTEVQS